MVSILLRGLLLAVVLAVVWLLTARLAVMTMDRVSIPAVASLPVGRIGWDGRILQFGEGRVGMAGPDGWDGPGLLIGAHSLSLGEGSKASRAAVALTVDAQGHLAVSVGGAAPLVLALRDGTLTTDEAPIPAFAPEAGDVVSMTIAHSRMSWPEVPALRFGYLDGPGPTWRRGFFYHLTWSKPSGAVLDLLWRFEQGYDRDNGWNGNAPNNQGDPAGLIQAILRLPASSPQPFTP